MVEALHRWASWGLRESCSEHLFFSRTNFKDLKFASSFLIAQISPDQRSTQINLNRHKSNQIIPRQQRSAQINPNQPRSTWIRPDQPKSIQIKPNQVKVCRLCESFPFVRKFVRKFGACAKVCAKVWVVWGLCENLCEHKYNLCETNTSCVQTNTICLTNYPRVMICAENIQNGSTCTEFDNMLPKCLDLAMFAPKLGAACRTTLHVCATPNTWTKHIKLVWSIPTLALAQH